MSYSKSQLLRIATNSPWTKDFRHLQPIPRHWTLRVTFKDPRITIVKPRDRIKYWNIVPGDRIRLRGDKESIVHEVHRINRLNNRVLLKKQVDENSTETLARSKQVSYSQCQLFVGNHEFPSQDKPEPEVLPVFATRLSTSKPYWHPLYHRYEWKRFAVNTVPRLPYFTGDPGDRLHIPWPKQQPVARSDPSSYETSLEAVEQITYVPPPLPFSFMSPVPTPSEQTYIKSLAKPDVEFDPSQPVEIFVAKELANPHSRAKKQARWQAYQQYRRSLLAERITAELKDLKGRTRREARVEATYKWRQQVIDERKAELKRRWKNRGGEAKMTRRNMRKARKDLRQKQKLQAMVLPQARNQIIPGQQKA